MAHIPQYDHYWYNIDHLALKGGICEIENSEFVLLEEKLQKNEVETHKERSEQEIYIYIYIYIYEMGLSYTWCNFIRVNTFFVLQIPNRSNGWKKQH